MSAEDQPGRVIEARWMSTHAIKTELRSLLEELFPAKSWYKRAGIVEMSDFAVHNVDSDSSDPRARRALELARVMHEHQRGVS